MKKVLLLGMLLVATSSFAEMEVEQGYGNLEFSASYKYTSTNLKEFNVLKELHRYEENQNDFLFKEISTINLDKNDIFRPYFIGENRKDYSNIGGGILVFHSYQESKYIGFQIDGRKVNFKKLGQEKLSTNRGMIRLLYTEIGENRKNFLISPYYIFDNLKDVRNRGIGIYVRQEIPLNLSKYNLIEDGLNGYLEVDAHRNKIRRDKDNKISNKNDSISVGIGVIYSPIEDYENGNLKIKPEAILGYNREFLEKRKYKSFNEKETNVDTLKVGVGFNIEYKNITLNIEDTYEKSLNSRNYENRISGKLTYKF